MKMKIFFPTLILVLVSAGLASGQLNPLSGAREIGLGNSTVALTGEASSIFANPGAAGAAGTASFFCMYGSMTEDVIYRQVGVIFPTRYGNFSVGYFGNAVTGLSITTLDASARPVVVSNFDADESLVTLGYSRQFNERLGWGINLKQTSANLAPSAGSKGSGWNADAGLVYKASDRLTAAASLLNLVAGNAGGVKWDTGTVDPVPVTLKTGLNFRLRDDLGLLGEADLKSGVPLE